MIFQDLGYYNHALSMLNPYFIYSFDLTLKKFITKLFFQLQNIPNSMYIR